MKTTLPLSEIHIPLCVWYNRQRRLLLSLLLTMLSCRLEFCNSHIYDIDGAWIWALSDAIHHNREFGSGFIFTYGPLGFLSTRYLGELSKWWLLAGDLLLFLAAFNLFYSSLKLLKGRWLVPLVLAVTIFRGSDYSQVAFTYFTFYALLVVTDENNKLMNVVFCGILAGVLFFVKINYGLITLVFVAGAVAARPNDRQVALLLPILVLMTIGLFSTTLNISLTAYIVNSIPLITGYDEAMYLPLDPTGAPYRLAVLLIVLCALVLIVYIFKSRQRQDNIQSVTYMAITSTICCFLFYKNAFTRFDQIHYLKFFYAFPLFFVVLVFIGRLQESKLFLWLAYASVIIGIWSVTDFSYCYNDWVGSVLAKRFSVGKYYAGTYSKVPETVYHCQLFPDDRLNSIRKRTIDIYPYDISVLPANGLNYSPRPIPQTYSVYDTRLDKLNGNSLLKPERPQNILIRQHNIDNRYAFWSEAYTKATMCLNYRYVKPLSHKDKIELNDNQTYLLLSEVDSSRQVPVFTKLNTAPSHSAFGDTLIVPTDTSLLYFTADISYKTRGLIDKILLQPAGMEVTFVTSSGTSYVYKLISTLLKAPVPISKLVTNNEQLQNFYSGRMCDNPTIKYVIFSTHNSGVEPKIEVSFFRFDNYPHRDTAAFPGTSM